MWRYRGIEWQDCSASYIGQVNLVLFAEAVISRHSARAIYQTRELFSGQESERLLTYPRKESFRYVCCISLFVLSILYTAFHAHCKLHVRHKQGCSVHNCSHHNS